MPRIITATRALPRHSVEQNQVKEMAKRIFNGRLPDLDAQLSLFDNARIERRQFVMPAEWYLVKHHSGEQNRVYLEQGLELLCRAATNCLEQAGLTPSAIDHIICVSSTGLATPTLDARLINCLGFAPDTTRLPIWGLGCAAGAAGLSRAVDHCRAYPDARVLLLALECCSLTFVAEDASRKNLVGAALFSDGAAAALVVGDRVAGEGAKVVANRSHLFHDSDRIMGWDFADDGMRLVLSPKLPGLIRRELPGLIADFLSEQRLALSDIRHFITHPGGARVIDAYRDALGLAGDELVLTEKTLREHGNISSVSVLLVLEEWLFTRPQQQPGFGLLSAFGPGFSAEMLLLEV